MGESPPAAPRVEPPVAEERWRALPWRVVPPVPQSPLMNMALDEVLTERVGAGERPPTLRFWAWTDPCVVLGRFQSLRLDVDDHDP